MKFLALKKRGCLKGHGDRNLSIVPWWTKICKALLKKLFVGMIARSDIYRNFFVSILPPFSGVPPSRRGVRPAHGDDRHGMWGEVRIDQRSMWKPNALGELGKEKVLSVRICFVNIHETALSIVSRALTILLKLKIVGPVSQSQYKWNNNDYKFFRSQRNLNPKYYCANCRDR